MLVFIHPDCHYHHAGDHDAGVGMIVKQTKSSKIESYGGEEEKNTSCDGDGENYDVDGGVEDEETVSSIVEDIGFKLSINL